MAKLLFFRDKKGNGGGDGGGDGNGQGNGQGEPKGVSSGKQGLGEPKATKEKGKGTSKKGENLMDEVLSSLNDDFGQNQAKQSSPYTQGRLFWVNCDSPRALHNFTDYHFKKMGSHLKNEWLNFQKLSQDEINRNNTDWFGSPMPQSIAELDKMKAFRHIDRYNELKKKLSKELKALKKLKKIDIVPVRKIAYNDRELGIFSFDAAAISLRKDKDDKGKKIIVSDNKKSFAYFEEKDNQKRFVRIYVTRPSSAAAGDADNLLWKGILAALLTEELTSLQFDVEVVGINGTTDFQSGGGSGYDYYATFTKFKKSQGRLNVDEFLMHVADAAYMRYHGFKEQIATYQNFKHYKKQTEKYGSMTFDWSVAYLIEQINDGSKYLLINNVFSEEALLEQVTNILEQVKNGTFLQTRYTQ